MTKTKSTKRALLISGLALFVCITMLVGSTFAWFTDNVTSGSNKIVAGTLQIDLKLLEEDGTWTSIKENPKAIFDYENWEPGYTDMKILQVTNEGNLALKWFAKFVSAYELSPLADVIDVYVNTTVSRYPANRSDLSGWTRVGTVRQFVNTISATTNGTLEVGASANLGIALKMQETADNTYQGMDLGGAFDIQIVATQYTSEADSFDNQYDAAAGTDFVGGNGTKEAPYLIDEASQLLSISANADEYSYYKIADGVEELDMTGVGRIVLNGSFDGNGVVLNNLSTSLFKEVGKAQEVKDIEISNFTANVLTTDGHALVRNIYNAGTTTFKNVTLHGYIEGQYNVGSFYNYGTANGDGDGSDYTVSFVNTKSDATLVCTTGNAIGGMLGHGFEGEDFKLSINMDSNSGYIGKMYSTGTATCYEVMAMCSHGTYILNGVEVSRYDNQYPSAKLTTVAPTATAEGYFVAPVANADHYVVYLNSQLTAYDENGVKIANKAGMTWNLGNETIAVPADGKVFDKIETATIVNGTENKFGYDLTNGALKIYSAREDNYASGWVTLQVNQYDANNELLATGILTVYTFAEP